MHTVSLSESVLIDTYFALFFLCAWPHASECEHGEIDCGSSTNIITI